MRTVALIVEVGAWAAGLIVAWRAVQRGEATSELAAWLIFLMLVAYLVRHSRG